MNFKQKFKIYEDVDFEDIELDTDNELFVDPYLIYISDDDFSIQCSNKIVDYFEKLLKYAKLGDRGNGYKLVKYLQENNEIRFGYSKGIPTGRGLGNNKGKELFDMLCKSKAVKTGLVSDIFDASIMIEKVGYDKISDFTVNIILSDLIKYTQEQCVLHNVHTENVKLVRPVWCAEEEKWKKLPNIELPVYENKPIILIPKNFVRPYLVYTYSRFYNIGMIPHYEREVMKNPSCGLVKILKRGVVPSRTKIRKEYPCLRENVINFISEHPNDYEKYKYNQLNYVKEKDV